MKAVIKGAGYILAHTPDMVLHNGTTQTTERIVNPDYEYLKQLPSHLRYWNTVLVTGPTRFTSATRLPMNWLPFPSPGSSRPVTSMPVTASTAR